MNKRMLISIVLAAAIAAPASALPVKTYGMKVAPAAAKAGNLRTVTVNASQPASPSMFDATQAKVWNAQNDSLDQLLAASPSVSLGANGKPSAMLITQAMRAPTPNVIDQRQHVPEPPVVLLLLAGLLGLALKRR